MTTDSPFFDLAGRHNVDHFHLHKVTAAQLAVDRHIEQREVAMVFSQFKSNTDCPDMFWLQRPFLANDAALVPGGAKCANGW